MTSAGSLVIAPTDKLGVFISSSIKECRAERIKAKQAVISINHRPLMFEGIGARSDTPRHVYLGLIAQAQIFVGIYKSNYGWIGPGMTISGVEDEFRNARARGIPALIYIH